MFGKRKTPDRKERIAACEAARVVLDGITVPVRVFDISETGALVGKVPGAVVGALCQFIVPGHGKAAATVVRVSPTQMALAFPGDEVLRERYGDPVALCRSLTEKAD